MNKSTRALVLCTAVLAGAFALAVAMASAQGKPDRIPGGTVWVTERTPGGSTLAAIDSATGAPLGLTSVGDVPIGVLEPRGTHKVYTSDQGADQLSVIDPETVEVIRTIPMGVGSGPHHMMASRNGRRIYVGQYTTNKVGVVDTRLDANVVDYDASRDAGAKTHAVWITPHERWLYATNEGPLQAGPGTFSKLNAHTGELIWEHPVGNRPSEVLVDRKTAYVSIRNDNVIRVYDVSGPLPVLRGEAEAKFMPDTLSLTNDKRSLIVGLRGTPARMAFIDTRTLATTYVDLPGFTTGHQWLSRNDRFTFMALEGSAGPPRQGGRVAIIDNRTKSFVTTYDYPNGQLRPHGLFYDPQRADDDDHEDEDDD